jgi:hypothetical protein
VQPLRAVAGDCVVQQVAAAELVMIMTSYCHEAARQISGKVRGGVSMYAAFGFSSTQHQMQRRMSSNTHLATRLEGAAAALGLGLGSLAPVRPTLLVTCCCCC